MRQLILKRLRQSELGWFRACRELGRETGRQRGLNLDADLVRTVFLPAEGSKLVPLRTIWHDGTGIIQDERPLRRQQKNWRLTGVAVQGSRFGRAHADDIVFMDVGWEPTPDGLDGAVVRWDLISQNDQRTWSLFEMARRQLGGASTVVVAGEDAEVLLRVGQRRLLAFGGGQAIDTAGLADEDWERALAWLVERLGRTELETLVSTGAEASTDLVLRQLGQPSGRRDSVDLAEAALRVFGAELLADAARRELLAAHAPPAVAPPDRWQRGGATALRFTRGLGLPDVFAGAASTAPPPYEDVDAWGPLGPLHGYQAQVAQGMADVLSAGTWERRRAVLWLPTGTGKTRVAVETLLMRCALEPPRNCIVWIADREELCEQAVEAFRHVWMIQGRESQACQGGVVPSLRVIRLWGGRPWQEPPTWPTVIVASIQTLVARLAEEEFQEELAILGERAAAIVFDEAHHVVAPSYGKVMEALGLARTRNYLGRNRTTAPPLLGLTATPARASGDETERLSRRFHGLLLEPGPPYHTLAGYQEGGFLAHLDVEEIPTGWTLRLDSEESRKATLWQTLPASVLRRAGADERRTARIIEDIEGRLDTLSSILIFGCSVAHARTMAEVLNRRGVRAAALDGETPRSVRWQTIQRFKDGGLQVLVNCDLLATGFDAPGVDAVAIARPVGSRVMMAQMVGRGLRGPRNGGTERCTLLDYQDNLQDLGDLEGLRASFRSEFLGRGDVPGAT